MTTAVFAQISDLHLDGGERTTERATRVMDHLRALPRPVDAIVVTGDVTEHATEAEYRASARILSTPTPVLTIPGNHDTRPAVREFLLGAPPTEGPVNRVHRIAGDGRLTTHYRVVP
ncbi:metallophosphoesterase [Saccharomonospora halophila]|uniref:metallophosphoesterase n=1 Tax=Saccharomonospora halophila TaxID=129922 RepID=UPI00035D8428|nr:metallophosphoesterase [Saccharomonospora halophila]